MDMIKVQNDSLVRDLGTGALLETDITKLNRHRARRQALESKDQLIDDLTNRINKLEELIGRMANG